MDRPRRDSRHHNGITLRGVSQPTFATKLALFGTSCDVRPEAGMRPRAAARKQLDRQPHSPENLSSVVLKNFAEHYLPEAEVTVVIRAPRSRSKVAWPELRSP